MPERRYLFECTECANGPCRTDTRVEYPPTQCLGYLITDKDMSKWRSVHTLRRGERAMNKVCQSCPARVMAKRRVDSISVKCHEACVILSEEHDVSKGRLHPRCPVVAYLRRVAKEIELP